MGDLPTYAMLIDGRWVGAGDGRTFESINPSTGRAWARVPEASAADVNRAVEVAHRAFSEGPWPRLTASERGRLLRRLGDLLATRSDALGCTEALDTGKLLKETRWQAKYVAEFFHYYAGAADKIAGDTLPIDKPDMFVFTRREPLGVVAAVVPWNSQLFLSAVKIAPALATGNTLVVKASEHASAALLDFARLFEEAGFPPGVVNVVTGHGEPCGRVLTSHPLIDRISFTGGPAAARLVLQNSASNLAEVSLELGGKSPVIVFEDADLESACNGALMAAFGASGQSCVAGTRLIVAESVADQLIERIAEAARRIRIGDPLDEATEMGPLCTPAQLATVEREVARAVGDGGRIVCGGRRPGNLGGLYYEPTIIECPRADLAILDIELFGPVLSVMRFRDEAEAIRLANTGRHGLAAGIFTRSNARAHRVSAGVRAGIVWVNTYRAVSPIAEFGGFKGSGTGRESGFQALYDYTRPKTVWMNTSDSPLASQFVAR